MTNLVFVMVLGLLVSLLFQWAFRILPREGWQILAAVPSTRSDGGTWNGINFTYYGLFGAGAVTASVTICLVLLGSVGVPLNGALLVIFGTLGICVPASRVVARLVEKKRHTLTVGGASVVGMIVAPTLVWAAERFMIPAQGMTVPLIPVFAAMGIAYCLGEGLGRLACISFGCCYGKPVAQCAPCLQPWFRRMAFTFFGTTRKVAYEGGLEGQPLVPVQAMTAVVCTGVSFAGMLLFVNGWFAAAACISLGGALGWRVASECLRSDYRGGGAVSWYQTLAAVALVAFLGYVWAMPTRDYPDADIFAGVQMLWNPAVIVLIQALGLLVFVFMGRSTVTTAKLSFHVSADKI
jgi:hypothetical protein